ncbi:MAG: hypothetical protein AAF798_14935 [Bacteroidota bacterium]
MSEVEYKVCPGTLAEGYTTYSPICLKQLFDGKRVSHLLPYAPAQKDETVVASFLENRKRISISGVQEKLGLVLDLFRQPLNGCKRQNFILPCVKKPRRCLGIAYIFCLVQNKVCCSFVIGGTSLLENRELRLTKTGEQGTHLSKLKKTGTMCLPQFRKLLKY